MSRVKSNPLKIASYLAPNLFNFYETIALYLARVLNCSVQIEQRPYDPLDDPLLHQDEIDLAFICGLPFIRRSQEAPDQLQAIVAPVMQADRYQNQPIYFSDIIVQAESSILTFGQLAGKTFGYNDQGSNSGYNLMRYRLMRDRLPPSFFGRALPSGSHQRSSQWVMNGTVDCAAIDSTVLEQEQRSCPELAKHLRVIESIGPCPMPPMAIAQRLGTTMQQIIQSALLEPDEQLQQAMRQVGIHRFAPVQSTDYQPLAQLYADALQAGYATIGLT